MGSVPLSNVCTRTVPRRETGEWKTDILKSSLSDPNIKFYRFVLGDGPTLFVKIEELQRVLPGGPARSEKLWGPFAIDPFRGLINGQEVDIQVAAPRV